MIWPDNPLPLGNGLFLVILSENIDYRIICKLSVNRALFKKY